MQCPLFGCIQPLLVLFSSLQCLLWQSSLVPYGFNVYPVGPVAWYLSWILFYVSHWNPDHTRSQSSMYLSLFSSMAHATVQLSTAGTTLTWSSSLSLLWALFHAFTGLMFTETLFCIEADYKVPPAVITSTNSARAAVLSLAVRGNVACGCTVGSATGYVHVAKLAWDSRSCWSPDFC